MKKILLIALCAVFLSSCSSTSKNTKRSKNQLAQSITEARALHEMGESQAAITSLSNLIDKTAHNKSLGVAYELLIEWLLETNNYQEAKHYASQFLKYYPKSPSAKKITDLFKSKAIQEKNNPPATPIIEENPPEEPVDLHLEETPKKSSFHEQKAPALNPHALGILLPLSGPLASFGRKTLDAMCMALEATLPDDLGKIIELELKSNNLKIIIADSEADGDKAKSMVNKLINIYHVALIIGDISNDASLLAAQICEQQGVPLLSLSRHPLIADLGSYIFMFNLSHTQLINYLVNYARNIKNHKNFAILYPRHNYGIAMAKAFYDAVIKSGGTITSIEAYDAHETTFTNIIKNLAGLYCPQKPCNEKNLRPNIDFQALFIPEFTKLAYVIPALVQADMLITNSPQAVRSYSLATKIEKPAPVQLLGLNSWNDPQILQKIGNQANGAFFVDLISFDQSPELKKFKEEWDSNHINPPTSTEILAYDATKLAMKILAKKNSREEIRNGIAKFNKQVGLLKNISFSPEGELIAESAGFLLNAGQATPVQQ